MRTLRSKGVAAVAVFCGAISLGLAGAGSAGALFEPETTITAAPASPTNSTSASFSFESSLMGSTFECQIDGNGFSPCTSPEAYSNLQDGSHTFEVQATDPLFPPTTDPSPATHTWTVDTTGPSTSITSGPSGTTSQTGVHFEFSAPGAASYECNRDGAGFNPCTSPEDYTVGEGPHSFSVRALDSLGNTGPTATRNWTVDTTGPSASITSGPSGTTNQTAVHFEFSAPGAASYECNRDSAGFNPCTSPEDYTVGEGPHSLQRARARTASAIPARRPRATGPSTRPVPPPRSRPARRAPPTRRLSTSSSRRPAPRATSATATAPVSTPALRPRTTRSARVRTPSACAPRTASATSGPTATRNWTVDHDRSHHLDHCPDPSGTTNQTAVHFEFSATGAASYECNRDSAGFNPCTSPEDYTVGEGPHSFSVRAPDSLGNTGPTATRNWTVDTTGPTTSITAGPSGTTNQTASTSSSRRPAPRATSATATAPASTPALRPRTTRSARVRTPSACGRSTASATSARPRPATGPSTRPVPRPRSPSGPSGTTNQTAVHFEFSAPGAASYECNRDSAGFNPCNSPEDYTVGEGAHSFSVRATDTVGNVGPTATRNWTVITTGPSTTITSGPSGTTNQTAVHFEFSAPGAASYECNRDGAGFNPCTSPQDYTVGEGSHSFSVRATDSLGNTGATATRNWTVDTTGPTATINSGPTGTVTTGAASFGFSSSAGDLARFECSVDAAPSFTTCSSPANYAVGEGPHTFRVHGVDNAGNVGPTVTRSWTVDTTAPNVSITSAPPTLTTSTSASFSFTSSATDLAGFECSIDGGAFGSCTSPRTYNGLAATSHTFQVHAIDSVGNTSAPATHNWTIDTGVPDVLIDTGPSGPTNQTTASFTFHSTATDIARFECRVDAEPVFTTCSSPANYGVGPRRAHLPRPGGGHRRKREHRGDP